MIDYLLQSTTIISLNSELANLQTAGGKGANLARLVRFGYRVPDGFIVPIAAYMEFIDRNQIQTSISKKLSGLNLADPQNLDDVSEAIQKEFLSGEMDQEVSNGIEAAYRRIGSGPVAVRSSANAEDLPNLSFAGQQDTYLNILGDESLIKAVKQCWGSLWTARAIGYRARNGIDQFSVGLAVVVQIMVPSDASGVLFSADPLTGLRRDVVINATFGLGEALVSGLVEPDQYLVDAKSWKIKEKVLGTKNIKIIGKVDGGTESISKDSSETQAIPDDVILELAKTGFKIAADFKFPQDIEWGWSRGDLYILQSRPITSLFPVPDEVSNGPLRVMFSFGSVQGMLDPITPLGQDAMRLLMTGGRKLLGYPGTYTTQRVVLPAAERFWADITSIVRNSVGRKFLSGVFPLIDPAAGRIMVQIWDHPDLTPSRQGLRFKSALRLFKFLLPVLGHVLRNWSNPTGRQQAISRMLEEKISALRNSVSENVSPQERLAAGIRMFNELDQLIPTYFQLLISCIASGFAMLYRISDVAKDIHDENGPFGSEVMELTRGMPNNVTTEMDLTLWEVSRKIINDNDAKSVFENKTSSDLSASYLAGKLPPVAQVAVKEFLDRYGLRGLAEIDFGRPRWCENPEPIMQSLQSYLKIEDINSAPDVVFERGRIIAERTAERLLSAVAKSPGGWIKQKIFRFAIFRLRTFAGMRESPKFFIIRWMGIIRECLLDAGKGFAQLGYLKEAEDVFFLNLAELKEFEARPSNEWQQTIAENREKYNQEKMRRQIPRLLLSDGRAFYEGIGAEAAGDGKSITGSPVSVGVYEGIVHVVFDPHNTQLVPGEILVCPGTDPAWTPLFLSAGALVMEVGGMMTHGAVVAREYGIPAIVGVDQATTRLKNGDRIRVDGSTGMILLIEKSE